jgi:CheY-like chemotaxis protein
MKADILLVNGSPAQREESRGVLQRAGYDVVEVLSMDRAVDLARRGPPLAVVVESPHETEFPQRLVHRLRHHPVTRDVPVLVLVPDDVDPETMGYDDVDCVSCVPEPCSPRRLLEELAYLTKPAARPSAAFGAPSDAEMRSGEGVRRSRPRDAMGDPAGPRETRR